MHQKRSGGRCVRTAYFLKRPGGLLAVAKRSEAAQIRIHQNLSLTILVAVPAAAAAPVAAAAASSYS